MGDLIKRPEWNGEKLAAKKLEELFGTGTPFKKSSANGGD